MLRPASTFGTKPRCVGIEESTFGTKPRCVGIEDVCCVGIEDVLDCENLYGCELSLMFSRTSEVNRFTRPVWWTMAQTLLLPRGDLCNVGSELKNVFRGDNAMKWLISWGPHWGLSPSETALVFIDNHDTQRSNDVLTYKEARAYKDNTCGGGWVCEHRWRQIYQMVAFRNTVNKSPILNWWDDGNKQIAFGRGDMGLVVINGDVTDLYQTLQTGLPAGAYCDIITGEKIGAECTGRKINVDNNGLADFFIAKDAEDMHLAIHVGPESRIY
ncbi:jg1621 [Pararge aegeria aegeria]|uniref:alpha-amylase n=1 Tax=Pararge aegeria aegeria TaxID=348720 RepID=A0A8S4RGB6_9NEOP|nr:jg1621 [Pararge aegeria aegeria]